MAEITITSGISSAAANMGTMAVYVFLVLLLVAAIGGAVYFVFYYRKFNIKVMIFSRRVGTIPEHDLIKQLKHEGKTDEEIKAMLALNEKQQLPIYKIFEKKGGYFKTRFGGEEFRIFKQKTALRAPEFNYLYAAPKKSWIFLNEIGPNNYAPILLGNIHDLKNPGQVLNLFGEDQDVVYWAGLQAWQNREVYRQKGFWEMFALYGAPAMFCAAAIMTIILLYLLFQKFEVLQSIATHLEAAANALGHAGQVRPPAAPV